jgi:hypothetical protein
MLTILYSTILGVLIPFILFIAPLIFNNIGLQLPISLVTNLILVFSVCLILLLFHLHNTSTTCETTYKTGALLNAFIFFIILMVYCVLIEYYPSVLDPFTNLFNNPNNPYILLLAKSIMIYGAVILSLTFTSFNSIRETCKNDITKIKTEFNDKFTKL